MNLSIDPELKALIPPLSAEERDLLEQNILAHGCRDPLVVWPLPTCEEDGVVLNWSDAETDHIIGEGQSTRCWDVGDGGDYLYEDDWPMLLLDGHNRLEICERHGLDYETVALEFESLEQARVWMRDNQMGRRNLSTAWRIDLQLANKEDLAKIGAAKRVEAGKETGRGNKKVLSQNDKTFSEPKHNTQAEIAKAANTSTGMVGMAEVVRKQAPELWEKAKRDEVTVSAAYKQIKLQEKKEERRKANEEIANRPVAGVSRRYGVVVIDPPWPMQKIVRDVRPNQVGFDYPVMAEDEIKSVEIPAADDCHLFVWTTHKFLPMALRCIEHWGFRYVCTMVWHKPGGFQPIGLPQYNCEFALYCRKGSPQFVDTKAFPTCFKAPRGAHSEKPQEFYDLIARVTDGPRIDMFNRREIAGFDTWGKEAA